VDLEIKSVTIASLQRALPFADYQAKLTKADEDASALYVSGVGPWTESNGLMPAFVVRLELTGLRAQDAFCEPFAVDWSEFEPFQLTTLSLTGTDLFIGEGHFGYHIQLKRATPARLLTFYVEPELYDAYVEAETRDEEDKMFNYLIEQFESSEHP
jgi:hypothetical protein